MTYLEVVKEKWDYLVILDACRYDSFDKIYSNSLHGHLEKRISVGSSTNQWRDLSFPDYYDDIVYISANPHFCQDIEVDGYIAGEHFYKIYEVWRDNWDGGLVLPAHVTKVALKAIKENPGKRFVIHYLQPHTPYIVLGEDARGYERSHGEAGRKIAGEEEYAKASKYKKKAVDRLVRIFQKTSILGNYPEWYIRKWFKLPPRSPMEIVIRDYSIKVLRNAYMSNLRLVLEEVSTLVSYLSGKIIVSSDHGELLGEKRCFAHPANSNNPILREVPWLIIDKCQTKEISELNTEQAETENAQNESDAEEVQKKLRELGYMD